MPPPRPILSQSRTTRYCQVVLSINSLKMKKYKRDLQRLTAILFYGAFMALFAFEKHDKFGSNGYWSRNCLDLDMSAIISTSGCLIMNLHWSADEWGKVLEKSIHARGEFRIFCCCCCCTAAATSDGKRMQIFTVCHGMSIEYCYQGTFYNFTACPLYLSLNITLDTVLLFS